MEAEGSQPYSAPARCQQGCNGMGTPSPLLLSQPCSGAEDEGDGAHCALAAWLGGKRSLPRCFLAGSWALALLSHSTGPSSALSLKALSLQGVIKA